MVMAGAASASFGGQRRPLLILLERVRFPRSVGRLLGRAGNRLKISSATDQMTLTLPRKLSKANVRPP